MRNPTQPNAALRQQILDAFEVLEGQSADRDDIMGLCKAPDDQKRQYGQTLHWMASDGLLIELPGRIYKRPSNGLKPRPFSEAPIAAQADNGHRIQLADYQKDRSKYRVSVYMPSDEIENAVALHVLVGQQWIKIPFTQNLRVCIGSPAPKWAKEQEINLGISRVRVVLADGHTQEWAVKPNEPVTISGE